MRLTRLWLLLLALVAMFSFTSAASPSPKQPAKKKKARRRKGNEGQSGQRCVICQAAVQEARRAWHVAKTTKSGSAYNYLDGGVRGTAAEDLVMKSVQKKVCNRGFLGSMPNPKGYAKHMPTVQYECENFLEEFGDPLSDAITLNDDLAVFCWDSDICGDDDDLVYDLKEKLEL
mmetsp:Transcript_16866/g.36302  ORF Transcript_16866/g.36302 Transcript_16866/m.36302 type:complete len:174 (+) Transcript_16866:172-693(+)